MNCSLSLNPNPNQWRFTWETLSHIPTLRLYLFNPTTNPAARCRDLKASLHLSQHFLLVAWIDADSSVEASVRVPVPRVLIDPDGSVDIKARDDHIEVKLVLVLPVDHPIALNLRGVLGSGAVCDRAAPFLIDSGFGNSPPFSIQFGSRIHQLVSELIEEQILVPERVLDRRMVKRQNQAAVDLLILWEGGSIDEATWLPYEKFLQQFLDFDLETRSI